MNTLRLGSLAAHQDEQSSRLQHKTWGRPIFTEHGLLTRIKSGSPLDGSIVGQEGEKMSARDGRVSANIAQPHPAEPRPKEERTGIWHVESGNARARSMQGRSASAGTRPASRCLDRDSIFLHQPRDEGRRRARSDEERGATKSEGRRRAKERRRVRRSDAGPGSRSRRDPERRQSRPRNGSRGPETAVATRERSVAALSKPAASAPRRFFFKPHAATSDASPGPAQSNVHTPDSTLAW